jgi:putative membrane protein
MEIPKWALKHIHKDKVENIVQAVRNAELKTSAEIVPMIVKQSAGFGHVPVMVFSFLMLVFLILQILDPVDSRSDYYYFKHIVDGILLIAGTVFFTRLDFVKKVLTTQGDLDTQVAMRAEIEYFEAGLTGTRDSIGILLFVSLIERRAVVLADQGIVAKLPSETWDQVCKILVEGSKRKNMEQAFVDAINTCANLLAPHFPRKDNDQNELKDQLIIKE